MLNGIEIKNFRGIKEGSVDGFGAVNIIVGPNGSGKSSLLEAIYAGALNQDRAWMIDMSPSHVLATRHNEHGFQILDIVYGKTTKPVSIKYKFDKGREVLLELASNNRNWNEKDFDDSFFTASRLLDVRTLMKKEVEINLWDAVLSIRADRLLVSNVNDVYGLRIESFSYSPSSQNLKALFSDRDFALNIDDLGAGIRVALRVFMAASLITDGALLLEEFDAYQHVESMPKFARALVNLTNRNRTQLFLATHSEETLNGFIETAQGEGVELRLIQTKLSSDGILETASLEAARTSRLIDAGIDVRQAG